MRNQKMISASGPIRTYNWLPRQGKPKKYLDLMCQIVLKVMAFLPLYIAVVVTITLMIVLFGVPFIGR